MLNIIVFSRDRASQLELFLRSMKKYFKEFFDVQIKILYKFTNDEFEKGYSKTIDIHSNDNIIWKIDNEFQKDLLSIFDKQQKHSVFFVDDIIFKEPFSLEDEKFKFFDSHGDILCLSLRLHPRLNYCYPARIHMTPPQFNNGVFLWKGLSGDYGYPMSLDGHIYRTKDIYYYIMGLKYDCPNSLESQMAMQPLFYPKMICYDKSIIVNNPINKVQQWNNNVHGNISAEFINEQLLSGKIIDLFPFEGIENTSCHQELSINFI
jgi:hypothetical protein